MRWVEERRATKSSGGSNRRNQITLKHQERVEAGNWSSLTIQTMGYRLMVGHQVLVLSIEVRVLVPQLSKFYTVSVAFYQPMLRWGTARQLLVVRKDSNRGRETLSTNEVRRSFVTESLVYVYSNPGRCFATQF